MKTYQIELDDLLAGKIEAAAREDRRAVEDFLQLIVDKYAFGALGRNHVFKYELTQEEAAKFQKIKRPLLKARTRNRVFERDGGKCAYCNGQMLYDESWHIDHIKPVSKGGTNDETNLVLSCARCNLEKANKEVA